MGLSRTVSEINGDFSRKSQTFPTHVYLTPPLKGCSLQLGIGAWGQKLEWRGYRTEKDIWRYLYNTRTWPTDGQTDGRTPADSKDRSRHSESLRQSRPLFSVTTTNGSTPTKEFHWIIRLALEMLCVCVGVMHSHSGLVFWLVWDRKDVCLLFCLPFIWMY